MSKPQAWVQKALRDDCASIEAEVAVDLLPGGSRTCPPTKALGKGRFGCVFRTKRAGVVAKVTHDVDEAIFVAAAMSIGRWPRGVVRYYDLYRLSGLVEGKYPVFLTWRDEACEIGMLGEIEKRQWGREAGHSHIDMPGKDDSEEVWVAYWLDRYWRVANVAYMTWQFAEDRHRVLASASANRAWAEEKTEWKHFEKPWRLDKLSPGKRFARAVILCRMLAWKLEEYPMSKALGETVLFYLKRGILLTDLLPSNIGVCDGELVITDPGNAVRVDNRWDGLVVKAFSASNPSGDELEDLAWHVCAAAPEADADNAALLADEFLTSARTAALAGAEDYVAWGMRSYDIDQGGSSGLSAQSSPHEWVVVDGRVFDLCAGAFGEAAVVVSAVGDPRYQELARRGGALYVPRAAETG